MSKYQTRAAYALSKNIENEKFIEQIEYLRFADLTGTESQAAWAHGVRAQLVLYLRDNLSETDFAEAVSFLRTVTTSRDYLDTRRLEPLEQLARLKEMKAERAAQSAADLLAAHDGAAWYIVHGVNRFAIVSRTPNAVLLRMPRESDFAGWFVWVKMKAIVEQRGFEITLRVPGDTTFKLIRNRARWIDSSDVQRITFSEFVKAWDATVECLR